MSAVLSVIRGQDTMPLRAKLGSPVAYHAKLTRLGIGVTGALMLSQAVYWSSRTSSTDGWFYKTQAEWEGEVGLTRYEQETARKRLVKLGYMQEKKQGVPCKLYYRVNLDFIEESLDAGKHQSSMRESPKLDCGNPPGKAVENQHAITEITSKTTSEIKPPCAPSAHDADPMPDLFDRFWRLYPNKKNKANARKAWAKLKVADDLFDQIVAGLARYCASPDWVKDGGQFIPHPTTWLNGKRWEDEVGNVVPLIPGGPEADETGVPVDQIIDLYHRACPNLAPVSVKTDKALRALIVERWNESPDQQSGKGFWVPFFLKANNRNQVFYRGQNIAPRLEALVSRAVFREIAEAQQ